SKTGRLVVLWNFIIGRLEINGVAVEPGVSERLREGEEILAGGEIDFLFAERLFIAIKPDRGRPGFVRLHENFYVEGLPLFDPAWHAELLDRNVIATLNAKRRHVDADAKRARCGCGVKGVSDIFIAIGKEDEPLLASLRKRRGAEPNGGGQIGALGADHSVDLLQIDFIVRRRLNGGFRAENQYACFVFFLFAGSDLVDVSARRFLLRGWDAVRAIQKEEYVHSFLRLEPLQARD